MRIRYWRTAMIAALGLAAATNGAAFYIGHLELLPSVQVRQTFDDNITSAGDNRKSDLVSTLSLGLDLIREGRADMFRLAGTADHQVFLNHGGFNNLAQSLEVEYLRDISRYDRIEVSDRFVHADEPSSFEDAFGQTSGRYSYSRNVLEMEYTRDLSRQITLKTRCGNAVYRVSREDLNDSFFYHAGLETDYHLGSDGYLLLGYDVRRRHFSRDDAVMIHGASAGIHLDFDNQVALDARAGMLFSDSFSDADAVRPELLISLARGTRDNTVYKFIYRKDSYASDSSSDVFDSWRLTGAAVSQIAPRLSVIFSAFFGRGRYQTSGSGDRYTGAAVRMNYDLLPRTKTFLSWTFSRTDSDRDSNDYAKNQVSLGLSITF